MTSSGVRNVFPRAWPICHGGLCRPWGSVVWYKQSTLVRWICARSHMMPFNESCGNARWWYKKGIDTDEAYVFVCYDSRGGRARFTPHTGFKDPASSPDALPRQSIELRAYVFWENEPEQPYAKEL